MQSADDTNFLCFLRVLTFHCEYDGLTGFVLPILVIDRLGVVTSRIGRDSGQDDQRVFQGDGTE